MKYINYFFYTTISLSFIIGTILFFSFHKMVGKIDKSDIIDKNTSFEPCPSAIYEYYNDGYGYKTERFGFRKIIENPIKNLNFPNFSGLINVRFVINCKNEIGYFRIKTTNQEYKSVQIGNELEYEIVKILKQLTDWNGKNENSYYQIYIKIRNGKVDDIF